MTGKPLSAAEYRRRAAEFTEKSRTVPPRLAEQMIQLAAAYIEVAEEIEALDGPPRPPE
jgi:hypothetical protein